MQEYVQQWCSSESISKAIGVVRWLRSSSAFPSRSIASKRCTRCLRGRRVRAFVPGNRRSGGRRFRRQPPGAGVPRVCSPDEKGLGLSRRQPGARDSDRGAAGGNRDQGTPWNVRDARRVRPPLEEPLPQGSRGQVALHVPVGLSEPHRGLLDVGGGRRGHQADTLNHDRPGEVRPAPCLGRASCATVRSGRPIEPIPAEARELRWAPACGAIVCM